MSVTVAPATLTPADRLAALRESGGFTCDPVTGAVPPSIGYAVSLPGHELVYPLAGVTADVIAAHAASLPGGTYQGAWLSGDDVYLDASVILRHLDDALTVGRAFGQLAIYDLANGEEIRLAGRVA